MVVQFTTDDDFAQWLATQWTNQFDWDEANTDKLSKHGLRSTDVEALFENAVVSAGRIIPQTDVLWGQEEVRHLVLLKSSDSKFYSLICTRRGSKLRPISCRRARNDERRFYEEATDTSAGRG